MSNFKEFAWVKGSCMWDIRIGIPIVVVVIENCFSPEPLEQFQPSWHTPSLRWGNFFFQMKVHFFQRVTNWLKHKDQIKKILHHCVANFKQIYHNASLSCIESALITTIRQWIDFFFRSRQCSVTQVSKMTHGPFVLWV